MKNQVLKFNKLILFSIALLIGGVLSLTSCKKSEKGMSRLSINLIDAPGDYQQVNVEILQVKVNHETDGWIDLPTISGTYDLLTLQNDVSATLVDGGTLPAGKITQLRLVLGDNNTVMIDSLLYPLSTPSAQQSGLKINLNHTFLSNQMYEMVLDFEADESIVEQGNGSYSLKPVISVENIYPI
ncbi:MAG TPA: DUF4382 domain-containing protein [Taishania sp.]|nr:DUF4382 domain-containing protein [Taishania sp.]